MKGRIFAFLGVLFGLLILSASVAHATSAPSFPSCSAPQGSVIASYDSGTHGIVGDSGTHTGSDIVYQLGSQALQCYCGGSTGIQTNWWSVGDMSFSEINQWEKQGWIYVPDGSQWGLQASAYLAYNTYGSCSNSTPPPVNNGGTDHNQSTSAPVCHDTAPTSAPVITSIVAGQNSVTLTWTKAADPVTYYLVAYGTQPGNYTFGNPNVGNVTTYTINGLSGNQTYYFAVRAGNGCQPGPFSSNASSNPPGGFVSGPAEGFSAHVLGSSTNTDPITFTKSVCGACLWWPVLLGEILALTAFYLWTKKRNLKFNRLLIGGAFALVAYAIFLILNKGHVCPTGNISLWIISLPCRNFWVLDIAAYALLSWIIRSPKTPKVLKKTK